MGIQTSGRKLEQLRFHHTFVEPIPEEVVKELAAFQNPDGGFGHGLEPDFRLPDSSPMATTIGLQIAIELELPSSHPMVAAALDYLRSTYDAEIRGWAATSSAVNDYPHAPWWHRVPDAQLDAAALRLNPSAEIVGFFLRWSDDDLDGWVQDLLDDIDTLEPHQLLCCLRLAQSPGLSDEHRALLAGHIERAAATAIETDPSKWDGYCIKPLSAIPDPQAMLAPFFANALHRQLDYELSRQSDESGLWVPHWSWGPNDPESWPEARDDWSGTLTLELLRSFRAFGRLA